MISDSRFRNRSFFFLLLSFLIFTTLMFRLNRSLPDRHGPGDSAAGGRSPNPEGKYIRQTFRWDISSTKTIISSLRLPQKGIKEEMEKFGVNLKMKHPSYFRNRGFLRTRQGLLINYRMVFRNSLNWFQNISADVLYSAEIKMNTDPLVPLLKFVQALPYKVPPKFIRGKYIMEFLPPLNCLKEKYGDCDSKSILLADLLAGSSFRKSKMGVVILKGFGIFHAILAVERSPLPGMISFFIDRAGPYIPLETTDKGWMPGFSNKQVLMCLRKGNFRFFRLL